LYYISPIASGDDRLTPVNRHNCRGDRNEVEFQPAGSRLDLARQVNAAADAIAATENMSLRTYVHFLDNGAVKLTQIAGVASQGIVTLTRSQALELMDRIAAGGVS
jgi:hypothetical protein